MNILKNIFKLNSNLNLIIRNYGINMSETMPNYFNQRSKLLTELLKNHDFNDKQQSNIKNFIIQNQIQLNDEDLFRIDNSVKFWKNFIVEKPHLSNDGSELIDHHYVLGIVEPSLLFIDSDEMKKRVNQVQHSGFCDSKSDVAKLFCKAPKAVFLQEWSDVIYKASYIHNRIVNWILNNKTTYLYPHPIVKYPSVLEKDYDEIKTRFLFAVKSGYKSKSLFQEISKATPYDIFRDLLVIDFDMYLNIVCKGLTEEEFLVYKNLIRLQDREEDKIFREQSLLSDSISVTN